jgi:tetratricopeptide (TPR) repeat protein
VAKRATKSRAKDPPPPRTKPQKLASPATRQREFPWAPAALLAAAVFIAYFPALRGGLLWDDAAHVTRLELQSLHGLWRIWFDLGATQQYYPLLHSAFWIEHKLWGDATFYYHLLNVLLHAAAACLLLAALKRVNIPGAFLAAGIFALHPVYVESVAWITEQKNTLSAVFYFTALLFYLRFDEERGLRHYFCALGFFVLALLSKTVTATLPAALLVIFWWRRGKLSWTRDISPLLPWFALGAVAGLFTAWVERRLIGAEGAAFELTLLQRLLLSGQVVWFYVGKIFWPADLLFIYPRWEIDASSVLQYLPLVAAVALAIGLGLLARRERGPFAGFLFFAGTLFPVLGFFNVYPFLFSFVADHFQYIASLGIVVAVSAAVARLAKRLPPLPLWAGRAACGVFLALLATMTWRQSEMYGDLESLYRTTLAKNPTCWMCRNNLGVLLFDRGDIPAALDQYRIALDVRPAYPEAHNNMGNALMQVGRLDEALEHYRTALKLIPTYADARHNIGILSLRAGRPADAVINEQEALTLNPNNAEAENNLGTALALLDRVPESIPRFERALRIKPDFIDAYNNLGNALMRLGRAPEAIARYEQALRVAPGATETEYLLGNALMQAHRSAEAIAHYQNVVRRKPDHVDAHVNLGNALYETGRIPEAKQEYEAALRIRPDYPPARENLATLQAQGRR